jgi:hypothetical protein
MKKAILATFLVLALLAVGTGCSKGAMEQENGQETTAPKSYVDAIQWNGATYLNKGNKVTGDLIGIKLGEIQFKVKDGGKDVNYQMQDGDAVLLDPGTMVYQVAGTENIAVKGTDGWMLYEKMDR